MKCFGSGSFGQLGYGDTSFRGFAHSSLGDGLPTVDLGTGKTAKKVAAGSFHICAILNDDSLKCWGTNIFGQLGLNDEAHRGDHSGEMGDNLPAIDAG